MIALSALAIIAGILLIDWTIQMVESRLGARRVLPITTNLAMPDLRLPMGLHLHGGYCWVHVEPSGVVRVGVTDLVSQLLGDVKRIEMPILERPVTGSIPALTVYANGHALGIAAPMTGVVVGLNRAVAADPSLLRSDPYGKGWLYKLEPDALGQSIRALPIGGSAARLYASQASRIHDLAKGSGLGAPLDTAGWRAVGPAFVGISLVQAGAVE